jgi:hypothetical protein
LKACGVVTAAAAKRNPVFLAKSRTFARRHAGLGRLRADFNYLYRAMHDGAEPEFGTFRTSPRGRAPFTFTSFGDQGHPN